MQNYGAQEAAITKKGIFETVNFVKRNIVFVCKRDLMFIFVLIFSFLIHSGYYYLLTGSSTGPEESALETP